MSFKLLCTYLAILLAFAFAELVDNALAATSENEGPRKIEIRLVRVTLYSILNGSYAYYVTIFFLLAQHIA